MILWKITSVKIKHTIKDCLENNESEKHNLLKYLAPWQSYTLEQSHNCKHFIRKPIRIRNNCVKLKYGHTGTKKNWSKTEARKK